MSEIVAPWETPAPLLDVRGLLCPLPVIKTQNRVKDLQAGELLDVVATDPGTLHDVPAWCRVHGHTIVATQRRDREIWIRLRVQHAALAPFRRDAL